MVRTCKASTRLTSLWLPAEKYIAMQRCSGSQQRQDAGYLMQMAHHLARPSVFNVLQGKNIGDAGASSATWPRCYMMSCR